jgi:hypothetical protein
VLPLQAAQLQACEAEAALKAGKAKAEIDQRQLAEQLTSVQQQLLEAQQQLQVVTTEKQLQVSWL